MGKNLDLSLYLILDPEMCGGFSAALKLAETTMDAGVSILQLRAPTWKKGRWLELARELKPLCQHYQVPLLINDHVDVAMEVAADGVHLGQDDLSVDVARKLLGADKIIGLSISNEQEARLSTSKSIDYVGIGPIFATSTKPDAAAAIGFASAKHLGSLVNVPTVLIGGLNIDDIPAVKTSLADGLCVISAICAASNPHITTQNMYNLWHNL